MASSFWLRQEKESVLLVSRSDQSTEFLLWQHERSGVRSWKGGKGGWKGIMNLWLALSFSPGTTKGCMTEGLQNISILAESSHLSEFVFGVGGGGPYTLRYPDIYDTIFLFLG